METLTESSASCVETLSGVLILRHMRRRFRQVFDATARLILLPINIPITLQLPEYTALVTQSLESRFEVLPEGLQRFKGLLEVENTLYRNLYRDHIGLTLQRIASRRKSMAPLATIEPLVWQHEQSLKRSFERFFPQLVSYTITYQKKLATQGLDRER